MHRLSGLRPRTSAIQTPKP